MNVSNSECAQISNDDAENVVRLFSEKDNQHGWNVSKWRHYYRDYPGNAFSLGLFDAKQQLIGHYGIATLKIGPHTAALGMHAYISEQSRGIQSLAKLMTFVETFAKSQGIDFLIGFARPDFHFVKTTLLKWKTLCWIPFRSQIDIDLRPYRSLPYRFGYPKEWYSWRFGEDKEIYLSQYEREKTKVLQLLKVKNPDMPIRNKNPIEVWDPSTYSPNRFSGEFSQPVGLRVLGDSCDIKSLTDHKNWHIEMGDSDTFVYQKI